MSGAHDTKARVERAARESYGRLLMILLRHTHDIASCEDALSEAFEAALKKWPREGIHDQPDAWLLSVARHRIIDMTRHLNMRQRMLDDLTQALQPQPTIQSEQRLPLLFLCAHPLVDENARTPLMLQVVLGLSAARLAQVFMESEASMAKRLGRAKAKLKQGAISIELPEPPLWSQRQEAVLDAIYGAYSCSWDYTIDMAEDHDELHSEALYLAQLIAHVLPHQPETLALLAMMLYCESRRAARFDDQGALIALDEQDTTRWDHTLIAQAEALLRRASTFQQHGRYQLEAALQSCHVARRLYGVDTRADAVQLYEALVARSPSIGAKLGLCAAIAAHQGPEHALTLLDHMSEPQLPQHQPYWALRAQLLTESGQHQLAKEALWRALGLTVLAPVRRMLLQRIKQLPKL